MADLNDAPSDSERTALEARVRAAADAGRISAADRDIRLGNVRSAQSRAELDLMGRDLDQLDASAAKADTTATPRMPPTPAPAGTPTPQDTPAPAAPYSTFDPGDAGKGSGVEVSGNPRRVLLIVAVAVVVLGLVAAFVAVIAHHDSSSGSSALPPAKTSGPDPGTSPSAGATPSKGSQATGDYSLSAAGIRGFLATYQKKFGTPRVVDLVMYPEYAVVDVPVAGGRGRQQSWIYRPSSGGWTSAGGVRAVFPGSATVNTRRLNVNALERNIARARATLKVETPTTTYVILRFIRRIDAVPARRHPRGQQLPGVRLPRDHADRQGEAGLPLRRLSRPSGRPASPHPPRLSRCRSRSPRTSTRAVPAWRG